MQGGGVQHQLIVKSSNLRGARLGYRKTTFLAHCWWKQLQGEPCL